LKLGVSILWRGATIDSTRAIALESERLDFEYLWLTEAWGLEALSTAGYLLGLTSKIKIGVGVLNVFSRSPAVIGMACVTLDQIGPGRFILGLGTSGKAVVEKWHGGSFSRPMQRTIEYVETVRQIAGGGNVEYRGKILDLSGFRLYTTPKESKQEIYIGAVGDKNLELAGKVADGAIVTMYPISRLSRAIEMLGRSGKKVFAYLPARIVDSSSEAAKARFEVARNIAFYVASMGKYYARNLSYLGFDESVRKIIAAHEAGGSRAAAAAVDQTMIDELSLIGNVDEVREKLMKIPQEVIPVIGVDPPPSKDISGLRLDAFRPLIQEP
jgi:alkanesulfonate monooxygenase SsuD/methylene tetrahydromethanopterin reductase-like flavin-dependent oxidoreductase (luciferase family)